MNIPTLTSCEPRLAQSALTNYSVQTISIIPWTNCRHPSGGYGTSDVHQGGYCL